MQVFTLFGIPVSVSGWFLFLLFFFTQSLGSVREKVIYAIIITVSVLVHEFGHATLCKRYGLQPRIWLTGWGGATQHQAAKKDSHEAIIVFAGPLFGYLLGGLCWVLLGALENLSPEQWLFLYRMVWVNMVWSTLNLIPMFPLDGGHLLRVGLLQKFKPRLAERITHSVGLGIGILGVAYALNAGDMFLGIMAGYIAFMNYRLLASGQASGTIRPKNRYAKELLASAEAALAEGQWHEVGRLGYQIRDQASLTEETLSRTWAVLAVAEFHKGNNELAVKCAARAKATAGVVEVWIDGLLNLGREVEARELLETHAGLLSPDMRTRLWEKVATLGRG